MAMAHGTGARGLRTIMEQTLLDGMYELPTMQEVTRCLVDASAIRRRSDVHLTTADGTVVPMPTVERMSA